MNLKKKEIFSTCDFHQVYSTVIHQILWFTGFLNTCLVFSIIYTLI